MTKAFRNTGIEGGYGSLAWQKTLWAAEKSAHYRAQREGDSSLKWKSISAAKQKPVKDEKTWQFRPDMDQRAVLLQYSQSQEPAFFGSWRVAVQLWGRGLIALVQPPKRWESRGREQPAGMGALFEITSKGRDYIEWLKAKGE